jgi:small subunit ribosomal protein S20
MAKEDPKKKKKVKRPTALKRDIQNEKKRKINHGFKSKVRTAVRKFETDLQAGEAEAIKASLNDVYSMMDKAVGKGVFSSNKAGRTKARLTVRAMAKTGA